MYIDSIITLLHTYICISRSPSWLTYILNLAYLHFTLPHVFIVLSLYRHTYACCRRCCTLPTALYPTLLFSTAISSRSGRGGVQCELWLQSPTRPDRTEPTGPNMLDQTCWTPGRPALLCSALLSLPGHGGLYSASLLLLCYLHYLWACGYSTYM